MNGLVRSGLPVMALVAVVALVPGWAEGRAPTWPEAGAAAVSCGVLPWSRRRPVAVFLVALAGSLVSLFLSKLVFPAAVPVVVALYVIGSSRSLRMTTACTATAVVAVITQVQVVRQIPTFTLRNGTQLGWFVAAAAIGVALQTQRRLRETVEERARKAEESREAEARRRVGEERLRIAQELHDVIGHCISVINVQAGVAAHLLRKDPAEAEKSLDVIRGTSGTALEEIRTTLGLLRGASEAAPTSPVRGLDDLPALLDRARRSGLLVTVTRHGDPRGVPHVLEETVYRLIQETCTNALRHAGPGTAVHVRLTFAEQELVVVVEDDGAGSAPTGGGSGFGLQGMRERVEAASGTLETRRLDPGFRVTAHIPTEAS
ncbi:histidine kinase [Streptomyces sp. NPDC126499]|uniref:sensor histidine kinase n=1 Tax=Streptomyces sp. NPDC126499 TaxID=3155314 RepID=UPI00331AF792